MSKPPRAVTIPHADDIETARTRGRSAARQFLKSQAPKHPVLRVAWCGGFRSVTSDLLKEAAREARAAGVTWRTIGDALGIEQTTARARFQGDLADRVNRYYRREADKKKAQAAVAE